MSNLLNRFQIGVVPESVDLYVTASQQAQMFYSQTQKNSASSDAISSDTLGVSQCQPNILQQLNLKNSVSLNFTKPMSQRTGVLEPASFQGCLCVSSARLKYPQSCAYKA